MNIIVLGSASGMPVPHRNASGLMIDRLDRAMLFDAGDGITTQILKYHPDLDPIDSVFISHTHVDHVSGLFMFLQLLHLTQREKPLKVYFPGGILPEFIRLLPAMQIFPEKWAFHIDFVPLSNKTVTDLKGTVILPIPNDHLAGNASVAEKVGMTTESYSFRVDDASGKSMIYTSDITDFKHLNGFTEDVDLLISECTHVTLDTCLDFARSHQIMRLLFTHIPPELDTVSMTSKLKSDKLDARFAEDGLCIKL